MFILVGVTMIFLAAVLIVIALVYSILSYNHIRNELNVNNDSNLNTANKYNLAAFIILAVTLAFALILSFGALWKYRSHWNSEDELEVGYSHGFATILSLLIIAMLVAVPVLLLTVRNNYLQFTTSDVKTLNYIDYAWFLSTAALVLFTAAITAIAVRLNWRNAMIDCAYDAFSMCKERLQKNRCGGMMNAPRGSPMNM